MFSNFLRMFCGEIKASTQQKKCEQTKDVVPHGKDVPVPVKFRDDIQTLTERYGELCSDKRIVLSLQDALTYLPRDRKRVDAYKALQKYLSEQLGVELIIESQKTKNDEKKQRKFKAVREQCLR